MTRTTVKQVSMGIGYCGLSGSGKNTNLHKLSLSIHPDFRGELLRHPGSKLAVNHLPVFFPLGETMIRLNVYSVNGDAEHEMTRRFLFRLLDGIVFVTASESAYDEGSTLSSRRAYGNLVKTLEAIGSDLHRDALVTQFNKRDTAVDVPIAPFDHEPVRTATAITGHGVLETFTTICQRAWARRQKQRPELLSASKGVRDFTDALLCRLDGTALL